MLLVQSVETKLRFRFNHQATDQSTATTVSARCEDSKQEVLDDLWGIDRCSTQYAQHVELQLRFRSNQLKGDRYIAESTTSETECN